MRKRFVCSSLHWFRKIATRSGNSSGGEEYSGDHTDQSSFPAHPTRSMFIERHNRGACNCGRSF